MRLTPDLKSRPRYNRGVGTALVCPNGKDKKAGRCLDKCQNGYIADKYGNRCRQRCQSGYRTYRYTCYKNWRNWYWRKTIQRGLGKLPSLCPQGKEKGLLYATQNVKGLHRKGTALFGFLSERI